MSKTEPIFLSLWSHADAGKNPVVRIADWYARSGWVASSALCCDATASSIDATAILDLPISERLSCGYDATDRWILEVQLTRLRHGKSGKRETRRIGFSRSSVACPWLEHAVEVEVSVDAVYRDPERWDRSYGAGGKLERIGGARYEHDADGQLVAKIAEDGKRWGYAWDHAGQLCEITRPDGQKVTFAYDALGRRVRKTFAGTTTRYAWDGDDLVHEITEGRETVTWEMEPGTFAPLAKIEGSKRYGVVSDHLGAPRLLVDEAGDVAWKAQLDIYGVARKDVMRTGCPWRWPGQYEDEETGLYYNRFRYYDPEAGRYISQDPIGLVGGLEVYHYPHDPLMGIDPFGLAECGKRPWIKRSVYQELQKLAGLASANKFAAALENGIVGPVGKSGIKLLDPIVDKIYTHELKIGGSAARILGHMTHEGYLLFDKFLPRGLH